MAEKTKADMAFDQTNEDQPVVVLDYDQQQQVDALNGLSDEDLAGLGIERPTPVTPSKTDQQPDAEAKPGDKPPDSSATELKTDSEPDDQPPQDAVPTEDPAPDTPMIPKARLDEVLGRLTEAERLSAYQAGQIEAYKNSRQQPNSDAAPVETPEQKISAIDQKVSALETQFNDGDLSTSEYIRQAMALQDEKTTIRMDAQQPTEALVSPSPNATNPDLALELETQKLETAHANLSTLSTADVSYLLGKAHEMAQAAGHPYDMDNPVDVLRARTDIAVLSDTFVPVGQTVTTKTTDVASQQPATKDSQSAAVQQRGAKLDLQNLMPPDLTQTGHTGDTQEQLESRIVALAKSDPTALENIPPAQLQRIMNS